MPVKKYGLRFLNPMTSINKEYLSFQRASIELIQGVTGEGSISKHRSPSGAQGRKAWRKENSGWCQRAKIKDLVTDLGSDNWHLIICAKITGTWLKMWDTMVTGTVFVATEFRGFLCCQDKEKPICYYRYTGKEFFLRLDNSALHWGYGFDSISVNSGNLLFSVSRTNCVSPWATSTY